MDGEVGVSKGRLLGNFLVQAVELSDLSIGVLELFPSCLDLGGVKITVREVGL